MNMKRLTSIFKKQCSVCDVQ